MFIHWGVYSVLGDGEWVMNNQNISISEYEKLPLFLTLLILMLSSGFLSEVCGYELYNHN